MSAGEIGWSVAANALRWCGLSNTRPWSYCIDRVWAAQQRRRNDDRAILEALAALEHDRWSRWERYRESVDSPEKRAMWHRKRETPYADLTHEEQESDRVEARKTIALLRTLGVL